MRQVPLLTSRTLRRAVLIGLALPLAACSPAGLLNALVPEGGYRVERDLEYGPDRRQRLDLYLPDPLPRPAPVLVFFYGGSWQTGDRGRYRFVGQAFASLGAIVAIPDYRLYPDVVFPGFVEDGAAAVAWVQNEITGYGGDPERIALVGHSAGAHIAAMVALAPAYLGAAGGDPAGVAAWIGLAGPYDFLPARDPAIRRIFHVAEPDASQPINRVSGDAPPALLLHGLDDRTVLPVNSRKLAAALNAAGARAELELLEGIGHIEIVAALAAPLRWLAPVRERMAEFLGLEQKQAPPG